MNYGLPYKGSKNSIAAQTIDFLPPAENFYDLFAGGCAITHAALLSGKYEHIYFNDINPGITQLFVDAIHGKYHNEKRWISREDFFRLKEQEPYIKWCWSFSNNGRDYLYSKEIEPLKKSYHYAIVFDDWSLLKEIYPDEWEDVYNAIHNIKNQNKRRLKFKTAIQDAIKKNESKHLTEQGDGGIFRLVGEERSQSLEALQGLQSLERLERLERLEGSYEKVCIKPNSVVYCDIPYRDTNVYDKDNPFDYEKFYSWAERQTELVVISEYKMPGEIDVEDYQRENKRGYFAD